MDTNVDGIMDLVTSYAIKIALAVVVYIVGKWLANLIADTMEKTMSAKNVDATVARFTRNISYYALLTMVIIAAMGQLGVQTASFVAVIGAAGLAIGFALQGSLANFAAGVLLILFRPFKAGDFIEAGGASGVVKEISIFSTILTTGDNKLIVIANNAVMGGNIVNYSALPTRRVDMVVGVGYSADLALVKKTLQELVEADERILKDPAATIAVSELADSSVNFVLRPWVNTPDYWGVFFDLNEKIKIRFDELGIEIPFPQMDVHIEKQA
ncbi:mechanosensitive ion channel [Pseudomaricurvus alkylphenolicus]|jgi:small conductance mechanosensitive channel|uniref:mechanosensitive ion channel family protein n=1 Tax=Pseudomaricurvus alkylphenolicus TaxID=1306991 RepID=UPI0014244040|nr:mechanosensitive ion channel domain-containing protein [Pseudomaricurvus alkylphenolicus]NIB39277.1 mechanosensitive ion channel [Pseudomaricurvus alkylphenolicus]